MKRKLLSVLVALIMIIGSVYPGLTVAYAATWNGSRSIPEVSGGVYQIATAEELAWFSYAVNSGSPAIKGKLIADIYLNDDGNYTNVWTPIGNENNPFNGSFDGNGFTIHGVYINSSDNFVGLFGNVVVSYTPSEDASSGSDYVLQNTAINISNIKVVSSKITGNQNVGGIVGFGQHVGLSNCSYSGEVHGTYNSVGGIIGWAYAESVVSQCYSTGSVEGVQRTGGTVGFVSSNSVVTKCYGNMTVTGTTNVGGVIGTISGSTLEGCFFRGSVNASDRAGGIVGYSAFGIMKGSYAIAPMTSTGTNVGGAVGIIYGGTYDCLFYSYETSGFDGPEGVGRTLVEMQTSAFVKELNGSSVFFCYDYTNINNEYPVLTWMLQTDAWLGELTRPSTNATGTYLISKPSELAWFAALVNGTLNGTDANPAANATVISDLLMNISVYDEAMGICEWTPIGTPSYPYTGTFNGGGYNIAGIYTTSSSGVSGRYVGLFGYVGAGKILNTVVIDGLIAGIENVGGIAGYVSGGTINNCCCNSEIQGDKAVGGIVGNLASSSSSVTASAMIGTINGTNFSNDKSYLQNVGGIVGYNNRATVTKSFNYGKINAALARYVGGIAGNNSGGSVTNCYNASTVIGSATVGGLIGNNNNGTVNYSYSVGKVTGTSLAGMVFGSTSGSNVSYCFFDSSYTTISNITTGATGLDSSAMTGTSALTNMSMSSSNWFGKAQDQYYYYYPQIISTYYSSVKSIKAASLASVKKVQSRYIARVEIDGRSDTYYETIDEALTYASSVTTAVLPVVYIVRDVQISSTITISSTVGIFGDNGTTVTRASTLTGPMFDVTGSLTFGSDKYGDDSETGFYINGNGVLGTKSGIVVENGATLNIDEGVCITNFKTASNASNPIKGAAIAVNEGTLNISGGIFDTNICKSAGGVIWNNAGTVTISGGTYNYSEATQGAVIYNENGTATLSGGVFSNNIASLNGGVASTTGVYGKTIVTGNASLTNNQATVGGALSVQNYATVEINGGTVTSNTAYSTGGALQIELGTDVLITGGIISGNISNASQGNAIYDSGSLAMKGAAQIDSGNDIYLITGKMISITDKLTCSGYAATITPQNYIERTKVLDGAAMSMNYTKIGISNANWHTLANGTITSAATTTVAVLSKNNAYSVEYTSLADAFAAVAEGETANITIVANNTISQVIEVKGDVTLLCDDTTYTSTRSGSFYGVMFDVKSGGVLRLGERITTPGQTAQSDYAAGTDTAGMFILDGGYKRTGVVGAAAVNVQSGAGFYMYDDAVIQNCKNTTTSAVTVSGAMYMYGGTIRNNISCYGGAAYIKASGTLDTFGGVIAGNTSTNGGDAVYSLGKVTRNVHTYDYLYVETLYDDEGNIIGSADPVYKTSSKTDVLVNGGAIYLNTNLIYFDKTSSEIFVTSLTQIPEDTTFTMNTLTLDFKTYTAGAAVVTGDNLIDNYMYFNPYINGYYILYNGTLGINKLITKPDSKLTVDRTKNLVSGIDLNCATVGEMALLFENNKTLVKYYDINGTKLKNTSAITTGCSIQLTDASGKVIDTLTLVVYGDVNCDYKIDGRDSVLVRAIATGMLTSSNSSTAQISAADVNFDGSVTVIDADHTDMSGLGLRTIGQTK